MVESMMMECFTRIVEVKRYGEEGAFFSWHRCQRSCLQAVCLVVILEHEACRPYIRSAKPVIAPSGAPTAQLAGRYAE